MSNDDGNIFGGKNPQGLYVPMSEDEQEILQRLVDEEMMEVEIHGWGVLGLDKNSVTYGDKRVCVKLRMDFQMPMELFYLDMELRVRDSRTVLFRKTEPTLVDGKPYQGVVGIPLEFNWDIAIDHMDPKLVKALKPGAIGLTSRRIDRDTHEPTIEGNMDLPSDKRGTLHQMERAAAGMRENDVRKSVKAAEGAGAPVKDTDKGPSTPDVD